MEKKKTIYLFIFESMHLTSCTLGALLSIKMYHQILLKKLYSSISSFIGGRKYIKIYVRIIQS